MCGFCFAIQTVMVRSESEVVFVGGFSRDCLVGAVANAFLIFFGMIFF